MEFHLHFARKILGQRGGGGYDQFNRRQTRCRSGARRAGGPAVEIKAPRPRYCSNGRADIRRVETAARRRTRLPVNRASSTVDFEPIHVLRGDGADQRRATLPSDGPSNNGAPSRTQREKLSPGLVVRQRRTRGA